MALHDRDLLNASTTRAARLLPAAWPSLAVGVGFGALADGIVLHQLLQWHSMATARPEYPADTVEGLQDNMFFDGLFHATAWTILLLGTLGLVQQWRRGRIAPSWGFHVGLGLLGWGVFNIVEGVVNHQLLELHHVRDDAGAPLSWDIGFLVVGAVLALVGYLVYRAGRREMERQDVDLRG